MTWNRGPDSNALLHARNLAKTIARDKPVSTFECTHKHQEHGYNITRGNHAPKYSMITMSVTKDTKSMMYAYGKKIWMCNIEIECSDRVSEMTPQKGCK